MATPWLVVGLGNPGPAYASTRHNAGFFVVDEAARRGGVSFSGPRGMFADVAETRLGASGFGAIGDAVKVVLAKPRTYMNESGRAVKALCTFHKIPVDRVIVVHDELDIDFGQLRIKLGGGDNGHNGLKSTRAHLGSGDFYRVRYGVGRPPGRQAPADYVLQPFPASMREDVLVEAGRAVDAVELLVSEGLAAAQNRFNS
ncbi:aminoacyl-tRNA hydrolase [Propionibacteriaceae bacterium G1746]|uniref:aminoacyl-tRNA hydrolase n=1 Tax=Aestuariimicrobium sp. G57 TaxID=3418485 RepID=UPI003C1307C9